MFQGQPKLINSLMHILGYQKIKRLLISTLAKVRVLSSTERKTLFKQIDRSLEHRNLDNAIIHSHRMLGELRRFGFPRTAKILCVGACNMIELYAFKSYGYDNIIGIDLVPPREGGHGIRIMDMHRMKFTNDSFDLIFCSGTFHCSYNPKRLATEFTRVLKEGGMIAITVPINIPSSDIYRIDAGSLDGLHAYFKPFIGNILWSETVPPKNPCNPNNNEIIRTLFTINKKHG